MKHLAFHKTNPLLNCLLFFLVFGLLYYSYIHAKYWRIG